MPPNLAQEGQGLDQGPRELIKEREVHRNQAADLVQEVAAALDQGQGLRDQDKKDNPAVDLALPPDDLVLLAIVGLDLSQEANKRSLDLLGKMDPLVEVLQKGLQGTSLSQNKAKIKKGAAQLMERQPLQAT